MSTISPLPLEAAPQHPLHVPTQRAAHAVEGRDGHLFLGGGNHRVEEFIFGHAVPDEASFHNFTENLKRRRQWVQQQGAAYVHMVSPDKQNVYREEYPHPGFINLASLYQNRCPEAKFLYPLEALRQHKQSGTDVYSHTDTHWNPEGALLASQLLLTELGLADDAHDMANWYAGKSYAGAAFAGDLGSKLKPVRMGPLIDYPERHLKFSYDNQFTSNTGFCRILINPAAPTNRRLLVFGTSSLAACLRFLSDHFHSLLFIRTPYMHPEALWMYRPSHVISGGVERYLSHVESDIQAHNFILTPILRGQAINNTHNTFYQALDGLLSQHPSVLRDAQLKQLTHWLTQGHGVRGIHMTQIWLKQGGTLDDATEVAYLAALWARRLYKDMLRRHPHLVEMHSQPLRLTAMAWVGSAWLKTGQVRAARKIALQAMKRPPRGDCATYCRLADILLSAAEFDIALQAVSLALKARADDEQALALHAQIVQAQAQAQTSSPSGDIPTPQD